MSAPYPQKGSGSYDGNRVAGGSADRNLARKCIGLTPETAAGSPCSSPSHGENRGSSPLGSAKKINGLASKVGISVPEVSPRAERKHLPERCWQRTRSCASLGVIVPVSGKDTAEGACIID
jgi:hypothetical protein